MTGLVLVTSFSLLLGVNVLADNVQLKTTTAFRNHGQISYRLEWVESKDAQVNLASCRTVYG